MGVDDFLKTDWFKDLAAEAAESTVAGAGDLGGVFMEPVGDSNPDSLSSAFSRDSLRGNYTGFGPGDYSGGYTGVGHTIYWGGYDEGSDASTHKTGKTINPLHMSPAAAVINTISPGTTGGSMFIDPSVGGPTVGSTTGSSASTTVADAMPPFRFGTDVSSEALPPVGMYVGDDPAVPEVDAPTTTSDVIKNLPTEAGSFEDPSVSSAPSAKGPIRFGDVVFEEEPSTTAPTSVREAITEKTLSLDDRSALGGSSSSGTGTTATSDSLSGSTVVRSSVELPVGGPPGSVELVPMGDYVGVDSTVYTGDSGTYTSTPSTTTTDGVTIASEVPSVGGGSVELPGMGGGTFDPFVDSLPPVPEFLDPKVGPFGSPLETSAPMPSEAGTVLDRPDIGFMLGDLEEKSPVPLDLSGLGTDEIPTGMGDYIGDIGNLALTSSGFATAGSALMEFAQARLFDVGIGLMISPFFKMIDEQTGNTWASRMIQLNLATMGLLLSGDPFGLIAAPIGWMIQDFINLRQRELDNDDPEKIKGKKWGYVREGDKWYPAVTESESKDEGFGTDRSVLMMQYGDNLKWVQEKGTGKWVPTFDHVRYKEFKVDKDEIYGPEAGNEYRERKDPLRDFYLMSDDEATAMLNGFAGGDLMRKYSSDDKHVFTEEEKKLIQDARKASFDGFASHDDRGWLDSWAPKTEGGNGRLIDGSWTTETDAYGKDFAPTADSMQDSRAALDFIHDYRHSPSGSVGRSEGSGDFWEGSIALRRLINEEGSLGTEPWAAGPRLLGGHNVNRASYFKMPEGLDDAEREAYIRNTGLSRNTDSWEYNTSWFDGQAENGYYLDQFKHELENLYKAQSEAAESMGFREKYKNPYSPDVAASEHPDEFWWMNMIESDGWSHLYLDNSWDMPDLKTAKDLHAELLDIEEAGSSKYAGTKHFRNTAQQHYLAQKAIVRFWAQKVDNLGGGPALQAAWSDTQEYLNAPPPFWQEGDNDAEHGLPGMYHLGWHYGGPDVEHPIEGVASFHEKWETEQDLKIAEAMKGYETWGITGGIKDPDYIAGRWGDDFEGYWESTGRPKPYVLDEKTGKFVEEVWDKATKKWVAPPEKVAAAVEEPAETAEPVKEVSFEDMMKKAEEDKRHKEEEDAAAVTELSFEDMMKKGEEDKRHKEEEDAAAAAAESEKRHKEEEAAAAAESEREAAEDAAKAAAAAAAAAAAERDRGTTHAHGADPEDPGHSNVGSWTVHHEEPLRFHHDSTVPMHIPTSKISADTVSAHPMHFHTNVPAPHIPPSIKIV